MPDSSDGGEESVMDDIVSQTENKEAVKPVWKWKPLHQCKVVEEIEKTPLFEVNVLIKLDLLILSIVWGYNFYNISLFEVSFDYSPLFEVNNLIELHYLRLKVWLNSTIWG